MLKIDNQTDGQDAVKRAFAQEEFYRWLVIRLGIACTIAIAGWAIYLCIIIRRLMH